jgi:hypothetical protein
VKGGAARVNKDYSRSTFDPYPGSARDGGEGGCLFVINCVIYLVN